MEKVFGFDIFLEERSTNNSWIVEEFRGKEIRKEKLLDRLIASKIVSLSTWPRALAKLSPSIQQTSNHKVRT